jgi:O-antigen/teichoic acid export membrane protein
VLGLGSSGNRSPAASRLPGLRAIGALPMTSVTRGPQSPAEKQGVRGRHRARRVSRVSRLRSQSDESLVRNSASLTVNLAITAICGFGALSLLTRLYSVEAVGLSATAVSTGGLIAFITQFGANYSLPLFLPTSKNRTALINTVLTATLLATFLVSAIFLALPVASKLYALGGGLFALAFLIGTSLQAGQAQLQTVLIADRSANKLAKANTLPNLVKLTAPAAFSSVGLLGAYIARMIASVVGFVVFGLVVRKQGHHFRPALSRDATRVLRRFSIGMYLAGLVGSLPLMLLPIVILARFGASQTAYWSIAIAIATLIYQIPAAIGQALLPEVAHRPAERRYLLRRSALLTSATVLPILAVAYVAAPFGLAVFGSRYAADSLTPLRWLILAGVVTILNNVTGTILFLAQRTAVVTMINVVDALIVLGLAMTWATNAVDIAICWFIGDVANMVLFALFAYMSVRKAEGRWENLGGLGSEAPLLPPPASPWIASQLEALDVLLGLSRPQP